MTVRRTETTRRQFIRHGLAGCAACSLIPTLPAESRGALLPDPRIAPIEDGDPPSETAYPEARYYEKLEDLKVKCVLCPRECVVADRERGYCGVRENRGGVYRTLVHSRPCAVHVDPIEKKPLYHFQPGRKAFSIATVGCNMECRFCQNWEISQFTPEQRPSIHLPPDRVAKQAKASDCGSIAYTYTEPVVFYEYMADCAEAGRSAGVKSVMISNGYIQERPLRTSCQSWTR